MDNKELKVIADAMLEKKGQDVVSLDLNLSEQLFRITL